MSLIRTTISLPSELHETLKLKAFRSKKTLGQIMVEEIHGRATIQFETKKTPYGMFTGLEISEKDINKISSSWQKAEKK